MASETERPEWEFVLELVNSRAQIEFLEQQLSDAIHVFCVSIAWILAILPSEPALQAAKVVRLKLLQMPQGSPLGQRLIELDEQNGGLLESKGIMLSRLVFEPREKQ